MNYQDLTNILKTFTKKQLIDFIEEYDYYIDEFISDNSGEKLEIDVIPMDIIGFYEEHYLNKEVF